MKTIYFKILFLAIFVSTYIQSEDVIQETYQEYQITITSSPNLSPQKCKGGKGVIIIKDSNISGTVQSDWGDFYQISGDYVEETKEIKGGLGKNAGNIASFTGKVYDNNASGTWLDVIGCSGTWIAIKK